MSMLHPILCLEGKRKEIFDLIFEDTHPFDSDKTRVADILLYYDDGKLNQLYEEVKNSNDKVGTVLNNANNVIIKEVNRSNNIEY